MFISGALVLATKFDLSLESLSQEDTRGHLIFLLM